MEGKANNLLTISGTVGTLLFGFGTFFVDKIGIHYPYLIHVASLLIGGISLIVISIMISAWAFHIQTYRLAMGHRSFFSGIKLKISAIDEYKDSDQPEFYDAIIESYLRCTKQNSENNDNKVSKITWSQYFFIAGILTVPLITAIIQIIRP